METPCGIPRAAQKDIASLLRRAPKRAARDAYGWTYEHLHTMLGNCQGLEALTTFIGNVNRGSVIEGLLRDMNTLKVTPLLKGSNGHIRPITAAGLLKRFALSSLLRSDKNLQEHVGNTNMQLGGKRLLKRSVGT